jgi:hypothetical protein
LKVNSSHDVGLGTPHVKTVTSFSLETIYTLPKAILGQLRMSTKQNSLLRKTRLVSSCDLVPFRHFKLNVKKNKAVVFCPDMKNTS